MAVIGMTGSGKSVLQSHILDQTRKWYVVLKSKADKTKYPQARTVRTAAAMLDTRDRSEMRLVLRPEWEKQQSEFLRAFQIVWRYGAWTVVVDELYYLDHELGLRVPINRLLTQGRDPGKISVCVGMQRPSVVTRFAIGEATHVISFTLDGLDVKILRDATSRAFAEVVAALPLHHFAWLYRPARQIWTGQVDIRTGRFTGSTIAA